jgi:hypothetical protein
MAFCHLCTKIHYNQNAADKSVNCKKEINMPVDKNGIEVKVGSLVKVIKIDPSVTMNVPDNEAKDINSMLNEVFEVYEIDEYSSAWVEKWWDRGNGQTECHCLSLSSSEMEVVNGNSASS